MSKLRAYESSRNRGITLARRGIPQRHYNKKDIFWRPKLTEKLLLVVGKLKSNRRPISHRERFLNSFCHRRENYIFLAILKTWEKTSFPRQIFLNRREYCWQNYLFYLKLCCYKIASLMTVFQKAMVYWNRYPYQ